MEPLKKENGVNFEAQLPKRPNTAELESFLVKSNKFNFFIVF